MRISTDGGITWEDGDNVRIEYNDLTYNDKIVTLLVNCTEEGMILDVNDTQDGANCATSSEMAQEIVDSILEENKNEMFWDDNWGL